MHRWYYSVVFLIAIPILGCNEPAQNASPQKQSSRTSASSENRPRSGSQEEFDSIIELINETVGEPDAQEPPEPFDPPLTDAEIASIVQQCVRHAITDPALQSTRDFYGTPGNKDVVLLNDLPTKWPDGFRTEIDGFRLRFGSPNQTNGDSDRMLGIGLGKLDVRAPPFFGSFEGNVILVLQNVGGVRNGAVIGGCSVFYKICRDGDKVVAEFWGWFDP